MGRLPGKDRILRITTSSFVVVKLGNLGRGGRVVVVLE